MAKPLEGIRVVEFGHYIAGPAATQILADLGAEVVKVEPPTGDQARSIGAYGEGIVCAYNRGKRSVVLDMKRPEHQRAARDLVATADVVVSAPTLKVAAEGPSLRYVGRDAVYRLIRRNAFPVPVITLGRRLVVTRASLLDRPGTGRSFGGVP